MRRMFRVKICGVTCPEDALLVARAGADAIGLNFYPGSPRFVTFEQARQVVGAVRAGPGVSVNFVGIFVNSAPSEIAAYVAELGLDWVQLHGEENSDHIAATRKAVGEEVGIIRAFRPGDMGDLDEIGKIVEEVASNCRKFCDTYRGLDALLIDARSNRGLGGTGEKANWSLAAVLRNFLPPQGAPLIALAGGLDPSNLAEAIRVVRPDAVDTASGVECSPGRKDPGKVAAFVRAAWEAFRQIGISA
ncbi:MAG: phosphoribosylanthranilate isomerase [Thermoguttaceae bacterium]|nr:phosphoribosylanthranilate isomerase [Thermoguttaceae bacterium]MDW8077810.1 phosphoribosylanthranilate isomerase [Thermoguttaceae bacterium]